VTRREESAERARGALAHGIDDLDETTRLVLALRCIEELSVAETALALSLSPEDVERAEERARAHLVHRIHHRAGHEAHEPRHRERAA
jgi:DNA-directed RNA polymerase specialized sigma24 family protein